MISEWKGPRTSVPNSVSYHATKTLETCTMIQRREPRIESKGDTVAIYHVIYENEGFEDSAQNLFRLIQQAQSLSPGKERVLYLDIDGHRVKEGGFDADMLELQKEFLLGFLSPFLSEIHSPLGDTMNRIPQENDIPPKLILKDERNE